ncbi:alcohol dehydrogenase, class V [Scheffersomyces xylosifermentans]|uniref:alcohol dehydrogenase, class V n=1 Tax=Scheffersomyces xylosifermentans TaxID=1304137 RepID=UPI00315CBFE6
MSPVPKLFSGFAVEKPEKWQEPKLVQYEPRELWPTDITIKVIACGVCGSDCHQVSGNWGPFNRENLIVGHEIIGEVIEVGSEVTKHKIGDIVGIGAQSDSCGECERCKSGNEQYCQNGSVLTYNSVHPKADGYVTQGGYASHIRVNAHFAVAVPKKLSIHNAAPLLCGGLTAYSPIVRYAGHDLTGKTIGIIGVGGIGAMALQIANALGAKDVYAFSRSSAKKEDSFKLGATKFIATGEESNWSESHKDTFDLILHCANTGKGANFNPFLDTLKLTGTFVTISAPPVDEVISFSPWSLLFSGAKVAGSIIGSMKEAEELLELYADKGLTVWIEKIPVSEEGVKEVLTRAHKGDVKYRFVLTDFDKVFT